MNIYTSFDYFWYTYHSIHNIRKVDKSSCENEWNKCIIPEKKKKAIIEIKS